MSFLARLWPFGRGHPDPDPEIVRWRQERPERRRRTVESSRALTDSISRAERTMFQPTVMNRITGIDPEALP